MYVGSMKRKKINLWLLLLIVLFTIAIIFTIVHITNSSKANSDYRYSSRTAHNKAENSTINNLINSETSGSGIGTINSFSGFRDIEEITADDNSVNSNESTPRNEASSQEATPSTELRILKVNNHSYTFDSTVTASVKGDGSSQYVELKKKGYLYKVITNKMSYSDLKSKEHLKDYIEKTYKLQVTGEIKSGTIKGNSLSICTMAENNEVAYLIITPLNDSEILVLKIFNDRNTSAMIEDLTEVLDYITTLKSSIQ